MDMERPVEVSEISDLMTLDTDIYGLQTRYTAPLESNHATLRLDGIRKTTLDIPSHVTNLQKMPNLVSFPCPTGFQCTQKAHGPVTMLGVQTFNAVDGIILATTAAKAVRARNHQGVFADQLVELQLKSNNPFLAIEYRT